jgi:phage baseplate assembly protein W
MTIYRGFSTVAKPKNFRLTDYELIKQDLINHFYTRKGERIMNPEFGTVIWNLLFEPFTEEVKQAIYADIQRIAASDPRIAIEQAVVNEYLHGLQIELEIRVLETNELDRMVLNFDQRMTGTSAAQ